MRDGKIIDLVPLWPEADGTTVFSTAQDAAVLRFVEAVPAICAYIAPVIHALGVIALCIIGIEFLAAARQGK